MWSPVWVGGGRRGQATACRRVAPREPFPIFRARVSLRREPQPTRGLGGLTAAAHLELGQDRGYVVVGGLRRDEQPLGQLRVRQPLAEEGEHLKLPGGQARGIGARRLPPATGHVGDAAGAQVPTEPRGDDVGAQAVEDLERGERGRIVARVDQRDGTVVGRRQLAPDGGGVERTALQQQTVRLRGGGGRRGE